jgi:ABC-type bacteriocin/lantibiotic exporter with double-glycine peptidase domain
VARSTTTTRISQTSTCARCDGKPRSCCGAIIHRPHILLFDEATSALDNRTQVIVSRSLKQLKATRIVIAHRFVDGHRRRPHHRPENGSIVQTGHYEQLIANEGPFADLAKRQIA